MLIFQRGNQQTFQQDMHSDLRESESAKYILDELDNNWEIYKYRSGGLRKALYQTHKSISFHYHINIPEIIWKGIYLSLIASVLQFSTPVLINATISYILSPNPETIYGIFLVLSMGLTRVLMTIVNVNNGFVVVI